MAEDILKFLGIVPDGKEHPADSNTLSFLGLRPTKDEHPAYVRPPGFEDPEKRWADKSNPESKSTLRKIHEAIDPSTVIPAAAKDVAGNIVESATSSAEMAARGVGNLMDSKSATGTGETVMGAAGVPLSLITGPVRSGENLLAKVTGNPDFANKAALMFPVNVGGPAVRTAAHNVHPTTKAADYIANKVGPENMPNLLARLESNPRLRPMDVDDRLRMVGQGRVADPKSPEASRIVTESMRDSAAGARDAVRGTYNEAMGPPPNLFEEKTRLENKAKSIGLSKIAPPLISAGPINTSSVLADIDKALNPAAVKMTPGTTITPTPLQQRLAELRQKLASDKEVLTDAGRLHEIQADLRREAEDLMSSVTGADKKLGRELKNYRDKLVDSIDASAKGYKEGLAAYRDQKDVERAFEFGKKSLSTAEEFDPSFVAAWVNKKGRSKEEIDAARLGQRYAIEKKMGSIKQSALDPGRSGTDVPQIEFNRKNIEHLHGKENTEKMFKHLQDERDIALTNNRGLGNSKTAETQAYKQELEPRDISQPSAGVPYWAAGLGTVAGGLTSSPTIGGMVGLSMLGARGAKSGYDWLAQRGEVKRNASIADILTSNTPETRALLSIAAQRIRQRNKLDNLLAPP